MAEHEDPIHLEIQRQVWLDLALEPTTTLPVQVSLRDFLAQELARRWQADAEEVLLWLYRLDVPEGRVQALRRQYGRQPMFFEALADLVLLREQARLRTRREYQQFSSTNEEDDEVSPW